MLRSAMPHAVRTSEEDLAGLPDYPFTPHYRDVDGLRVAHIDEGEGARFVPTDKTNDPAAADSQYDVPTFLRKQAD